MSYCAFADAGVSSFAPSLIQRSISAICVACNASAFCGISTLPCASGLMSFSKFDSAALPGTTATASSPPFSKAANSVMM